VQVAFVHDDGIACRAIDGDAKLLDAAAEIAVLSAPIASAAPQRAFTGHPIPDAYALFNHDPNLVLGRMKSGTLRLAERERGLIVEIDPPDTQDARDLVAKIQRGDIDQMSFAFTMRGGVQTWDDSQSPPLRTIEKVGDLYDVSVVTRGAYPTTEVGVRSLEAWRDTQRRQHNFRAASQRVRLRGKLDLKVRETASRPLR
jgi:HK97 family phage prohead protease